MYRERNSNIYDRHCYMLNEAVEDGKSDGFRFDGNYTEYIASNKYGDIKDFVSQMEIDYDHAARFVERHDQTFERTMFLFIIANIVLAAVALFGLLISIKGYFMLNGSPLPLLFTLIAIVVLIAVDILLVRKWNEKVCQNFYIFGYLSVAQQHLNDWLNRMESHYTIPYDFCFADRFMNGWEWTLYERLKDTFEDNRQNEGGFDIDFFPCKRVVNEKLQFDALDDEVREDVV